MKSEEQIILNIFRLRSNHQLQDWRILYLEKEGAKKDQLISIMLQTLISESQHQIQLAQTLLIQIKAL
jgi:hypothetical protein